MPIYPAMDFRHVLRELSVNRQDPCEVIRELVSNSYDATATEMTYWPLLQHEGFAFFDNGIGLDQENEVNGITPYSAFFSIGKSTKTFGHQVGYKCQGSKLCFACSRIAIVTRCKEEADWRAVVVENPKVTLSTDYNVAPQVTSTPWLNVAEFLTGADERTNAVLAELSEDFFKTRFQTAGTLIIVIGIEVEDYLDRYFPGSTSEAQKRYLYNYLRFYTKHGDVRQISKTHGFKADEVTAFNNLRNDTTTVGLQLWCGDDYISVPKGYPYLKEDRGGAARSPENVSSLRHGRFVARKARVFSHDGRKFGVVLAVDGNRRAHDEYATLDRRRKTISGVRLTDQRGVFLSSQGVKIAQYNELLQRPPLSHRYACLATGDGQSHYALIIDGPFELVTNRNAPSNEALKTLKDRGFVAAVKKFLDRAYDTDSVFRELVNVLNKQRAESKREAQVNALDETKQGLASRRRFKVLNVPQLEGHWFISPERGEEHWVGALYTLFAHFAPDDSKYSNYWCRPLTFSARGIDSVAQPFGLSTLRMSDLKAVEYKYLFAFDEEFNHPLHITDLIVCWEMVEPSFESETIVVDSYDCFGRVDKIPGCSPSLAYRIVDVASVEGDEFSKTVLVVCLEKLLAATFKLRNTVPPKKRA